MVKTTEGEIVCEIRGKVKHKTSGTTPVAVGDEVIISESGDGTGMIEEVLPRKSMFFRPAKGSDSKKQVIAANIDQLAAVASVMNPPLKPGLIDRFLIAAEIGNLEALVIINKIDLGETDLFLEVVEAYRAIDVPVLTVSAISGEGIEELEERLASHKTIFAGHSGVGKSTILNTINPNLNLKVGEISDYSEKGVHTTTHIQLFELPKGGYVVDSPGLKVLGLWEVEQSELDEYFQEFEKFRDECYFSGCSHTHEPDCAVKRAVEEGIVPAFRYDSYVSIYQSLGE